MNTLNLCELPLDILEEFLQCVESTNDLLSLGLTSRCLYNLTIPHHLHFRHISCSLFHANLFRALSANPAAAYQCHKLLIMPGEIHREEPLRIPSGYHFVEDTQLAQRGEEGGIGIQHLKDSFDALSGAVRVMPCLKVLAWSDKRPSREFYEALFHLRRTLESLDIRLHARGGNGYSNPSGFRELATSQHWRLPHLTQLCLINELLPVLSDFRAQEQALCAILCASPSLEDLCIQLSATDIVHNAIEKVVCETEWPNLQRLTILGISLNGARGTLLKHPRLENLYICHSGDNEADIIFDSLPQLRSLVIDYVPSISHDQINRLTHLSIVKQGDIYWSALEDILPFAHNMTSLVLSQVKYKQDCLLYIARSLPMLNKLAIRWSFTSEEQFSWLRDEIGHWQQLTTLLPNLSHLGTIPLEVFFAPKSIDWFGGPSWSEQRVGLEDRLAFAVKQICSPESRLEHIHFIADTSYQDPIWVFLDPETQEISQSLSPPIRYRAPCPKGLERWDGCYFSKYWILRGSDFLGMTCLDRNVFPESFPR